MTDTAPGDPPKTDALADPPKADPPADPPKADPPTPPRVDGEGVDSAIDRMASGITALTETVAALVGKVTEQAPDPTDSNPAGVPWTHRGFRKRG